jgi:Flp pilus assembly protein TadG
MTRRETDSAQGGNRRGAILLLMGVSMVALMSLLVLCIDGGTLQEQKRRAQTAADAGALAGAVEILRNR